MYLYIYIYIHIYAHIYIYIYTYIHTYILIISIIIIVMIIIVVIINLGKLGPPAECGCADRALGGRLPEPDGDVYIINPVSVRRFPSFRTQPLENLTLLPMKTWISEQPSPWRKYHKRKSCYGDRV